MRKAVLSFLHSKNKILLINEQYHDQFVWNGVSGYIEAGESSQVAVCRELKEEIGVEVDSKTVRYLGTHELFDIYQVDLWNGNPTPQETSIKALKWFALSEVPYENMHPGNDKWLPEFINKILR